MFCGKSPGGKLYSLRRSGKLLSGFPVLREEHQVRNCRNLLRLIINENNKNGVYL